MRAAPRFHRRPLLFGKGARVVTYVPTDRIHETAIRGAMARDGWRLASPSVSGDRRPVPERRAMADRSRG